mmetsp:Transcript_66342/g.183200  ORF Transcript_66342/g.183200 Transcript_66342/m.183200 type:complete len:114 (-) Transcript_66342:603-944(-)
MLHHVSKGVYVEQFRRWFSVFPREHFFVESLEAFRQNPVAVYTRVCSFLGVEATGSASFPTDAALENQLARRYNEGTNQDTEAIPEGTLAVLEAFYAPYNERLFALLGKRFDW